MNRISFAEIDVSSTLIKGSSTQTVTQTEISVEPIYRICVPPGDHVFRSFNKNQTPVDRAELLEWNVLSKCDHAPVTAEPNIFWFGCNDATVSEVHSTLTRPGGIITHRNFGNLFQVSDLSLRASLADAVAQKNGLKVFVVGHTKCRAIQRAIEIASGPPPPSVHPDVETWIAPLVKLVTENPGEKPEVLAKLNVCAQRLAVQNYINSIGAPSPFMGAVEVNGWVYNDDTGGLEG